MQVATNGGVRVGATPTRVVTAFVAVHTLIGVISQGGFTVAIKVTAATESFAVVNVVAARTATAATAAAKGTCAGEFMRNSTCTVVRRLPEKSFSVRTNGNGNCECISGICPSKFRD